MYASVHQKAAISAGPNLPCREPRDHRQVFTRSSCRYRMGPRTQMASSQSAAQHRASASESMVTVMGERTTLHLHTKSG